MIKLFLFLTLHGNKIVIALTILAVFLSDYFGKGDSGLLVKMAIFTAAFLGILLVYRWTVILAARALIPKAVWDNSSKYM